MDDGWKSLTIQSLHRQMLLLYEAVAMTEGAKVRNISNRR